MSNSKIKERKKLYLNKYLGSINFALHLFYVEIWVERMNKFVSCQDDINVVKRSFCDTLSQWLPNGDPGTTSFCMSCWVGCM